MFATLKQIFKPTNKDIKKRLLFTLLVLLVFRVGTSIRVPGTEDVTSNLGFLELINTMGGGALKQFSIFALGVMPYITASIIISLLQSSDIIPYLTELKNQGEVGRHKINKVTRYIGLAFAFVQGYMFSFTFLGNSGTPMEYMRIAIILTAGTAFLLWLGDQVTQKGLGNGISLIIMAGIVSTMPKMFIDAYNALISSGTSTLFIGIVSFSIFTLVYLGIVVGMIYIQISERRVPIQYSNMTRSSYGAKQSYMPLKINSAGVIPVIFASTIIAIPTTIAQFIKNDSFSLFAQKYLSFSSVVGFSLYIILIIAFSYFQTYMQINPKELSENLQKNGGYIPGIRPGDQTKIYIKQVLSRLTAIGALFLVIIAALPILFSTFTNLPTSVTIGGTGLLIVVGVALETYKQLESSLISRSYKGGYKRL
ncbi:MAG: preprotein translocase subunit SecY [Bacilli bacterium]